MPNIEIYFLTPLCPYWKILKEKPKVLLVTSCRVYNNLILSNVIEHFTKKSTSFTYNWMIIFLWIFRSFRHLINNISVLYIHTSCNKKYVFYTSILLFKCLKNQNITEEQKVKIEAIEFFWVFIIVFKKCLN